MHLKTWAAFGILLSAALGAQAQQASRTPDPADPSAAVPATTYVSVLTGVTSAQSGSPSPDKAWRAANDTVAGQPGHAGHHSQAPEARQDDAPPKAAPVSPPQDHHKHH